MKIGGFEIIETLGGGGSGIVHKARHETLGRIVAVKQLNRPVQEGDRTFDRFRREAQLMAQIRSDHVVTLYSYQVVDGRPVLEIEYLANGSLERLMHERPLELDAALRIVEDILHGLQALHGAGIVHRDIKPANVLQDEHGRFKLSDFGLSVVESDTRPTLEAATIRYVAPECIADEPSCDFRSDLYSVGMVLYEGILGADGFRDAFPELTPAAAFGSKWLGWLKDATREATPLHLLRPEIPAPVAQFAARLMAKDPELRFSSADAALDALTPLLGARPMRLRVPMAPIGSQEQPPLAAPAAKPRSAVRTYAGMALGIAAISTGALTLAVKMRTAKLAAARTLTAEAAPNAPAEIPPKPVEPAPNTLVIPPPTVPAAPPSFPSRPDPRPAGARPADAPTPGLSHVSASTSKPPQAAAIAPGPAARTRPSPAARDIRAAARDSDPAGAAEADLSRLLAAHVRVLLIERGVTAPPSARMSLAMSTRPAPFTGRGITADYVATLRTSAGEKSFKGQVLEFGELSLRQQVVEKAAADIAAHLGGNRP